MMLMMTCGIKAQAPDFTNKPDSISYAMGHNFARSVKANHIPLSTAHFYRGMMDEIKGDSLLLSEEQMELLLQQFQQEAATYREAALKKEAKENMAKSQAFLEENKTRPGIFHMESGLQYQVIEKGRGRTPGPEARVLVHYTGKLIDGTIFDSTAERGEPMEIPVNKVIPGWREGLRMMKPGGKRIFYIPPSLGYGERATGSIPGNATLIFEVELIKIIK